ncbi:MAG TPA: hypothetical protein PKE21_15015 [Flavobacteriales bacterium]|nr:hypothetical protein [Flavobacteriales bacterium]HMR28790.1 hypothetical protein [Flavobacteriales bacterium]
MVITLFLLVLYLVYGRDRGHRLPWLDDALRQPWVMVALLVLILWSSRSVCG